MSSENINTTFYAHTKDSADKLHWQKLIDHLRETSRLAKEFGMNANVSELAGIAGLVHDLGKYSQEFQSRLEGKRIKCNHTTAGAKELLKLFKGTPREPLALLLAYCITGHHSGLLDYGDSTDLPGDGTLQARLKTEVTDYQAFHDELDLRTEQLPTQLHIRPQKGSLGVSCAFLTRMIYSALVDADFQETEEFVRGKQSRGGFQTIEELSTLFNNHLHRFDHPQREIDRKRNETLQACIDKASLKPGFFTLTVPTGGGKTLASMAFALNHARQNGLHRVIYVIPFTTIIEQNASKFKEILGEKNVLEHHSYFDWERLKQKESDEKENQTNEVYTKLKLAAENWDIPIVVTTNVQFFESLYANRSRRCRKLHNIAKSVIIFDEAQMLPREYLKPAMSAVWELVTNYGASSVFCTATQPDLKKFLPEETELTELAPTPQHLFDFYHRVNIENLGKLGDVELTERLCNEDQALCIVNTRRHAKGLHDMLAGEDTFHLSTLMCPKQRQETLEEIRCRLSHEKPCRVISTSVIEAGVDLDFKVGYRAIAGLDSINQAAGRVNREMHKDLGTLYIFDPDTQFIKRTPKYIAQTAEVTRSILRDYSASPISVAAIQAYFDLLYSLNEKNDFDSKGVMGCFKKAQPFMLNFAEAAQKFKIIEDVSVPVIIPYDKEAEKFINELENTPFPLSTLRKLQPYTINIYEQEFNALSAKGVVMMIAENYAVLNTLNPQIYNQKTGLVVPDNSGGEGIFS